MDQNLLKGRATCLSAFVFGQMRAAVERKVRRTVNGREAGDYYYGKDIGHAEL
jgi:hypothetical protein